MSSPMRPHLPHATIQAMQDHIPGIKPQLTQNAANSNKPSHIFLHVTCTLLTFGLPALATLVYKALHQPSPLLIWSALFSCGMYIVVCVACVAWYCDVRTRVRDAWRLARDTAALLRGVKRLSLVFAFVAALNMALGTSFAVALDKADSKPSPMPFSVFAAGRRSVVGSYVQHSTLRGRSPLAPADNCHLYFTYEIPEKPRETAREST